MSELGLPSEVVEANLYPPPNCLEFPLGWYFLVPFLSTEELLIASVSAFWPAFTIIRSFFKIDRYKFLAIEPTIVSVGVLYWMYHSISIDSDIYA